MSAIGVPPYRKGSKKTTDMSVGILHGKPTIQVNWGGRIYGVPLYLTGAGNERESLDVGNIRASGNITFSKNSRIYNKSNRMLMVGGLTTSDDNNMVIGTDTNLSSLTGHANNISNLALGVNVLPAAINARFNIAIGDDAMRYIGRNASETAVDTSNNVAIGHYALKGADVSRAQAIGNIAIGYLSMSQAHKANSVSATTSSNVCVGVNAGSYVSSHNNVYIGNSAGVGISTGSTGNNNIGIGQTALNDIQDGNSNISIGYGSGDKLTRGDGNITLGYQAGDTITTGSNNICIGYDADVNSSSAKNRVAISPVAIALTLDHTTSLYNTNIILSALYDSSGDSGTDGGYIKLIGAGDITLDTDGDINLDAAGADVNILQADLNIPTDNKVVFGDAGEYIIGDGTDLDIVSSNHATIDAAGDIILDAASNDIVFANAGSLGGKIYTTAALTKIMGNVTNHTITLASAGTGDINLSSTTSIDFNAVAGGVAADQIINIQGNGTTWAKFTAADSQITLYENAGASTNDYLNIKCEAEGVTTITTVDANATAADLIFEIDGTIDMLPATGESIRLGVVEGDNIVLGIGGNQFGNLKGVTDEGGELILYEMIGYDRFTIAVHEHGETDITTTDGGAYKQADLTFNIDGYIDLNSVSGEDITLDSGGDIILDSADGTITLLDAGSTYAPSASSDAVNKGYVDAERYTQYHFIKVGFVSTVSTRQYIPLAGAEDMRELTIPSSGSERLSMICPFDGSFETAWVRSEYIGSSTVFSLHYSADGDNTEVPPIMSMKDVTVNMAADDTSYEFDFTGGSNTFSQGDILMFSINPTWLLGDCHMMLVLKYDVST